MHEKKFITYTNEKAPEYQKKTERKEKGRANLYYAVNNYLEIKKKLNSGLIDDQEYEAKISEVCEFPKKYLTRNLTEDTDKNYTLRLLEEINSNKDLKKRFIDNLRRDVNVEDVLKFLHEGDINNELILDILTWHKEIFDKKESDFQKRVEEYIKDFESRIFQMIDKGEIKLDKNLVQKRLKNLSFILLDSIEFGKGENEKFPASYSNLRISIHEYSSLDQEKHVVFHEMTHAVLAGKIIKLEKHEGFLDNNIEFGREGLRIPGHSKNYFELKYKYEGLNEAITEELNQKIIGGKLAKYEPYPLERLEMRRMINIGVPEQLFYDAYCENYNPEIQKKKGEALNAWKKLFQKIKEVMGNEYLKKLAKNKI